MVARRSTVMMVCVLILGTPANAGAADVSPTPACSRELAAGGDVQAFANSLGAGDVGCPHGGTYTFSGLRINGSGITLTSYPGERAKLLGGSIYVPPESTTVTLADLDIDTELLTGGIGVQLFGNGARLLDSDVTNNNLGESCVTLSNYGGAYPTVHGVVIRGNRIHGCGKVADGAHDHGVYVANADGAVVSDNVIEDVHGGWGIQLWTTSINGVFERNVIRASPTATQGGVVIVAGARPGTSSGTTRSSRPASRTSSTSTPRRTAPCSRRTAWSRRGLRCSPTRRSTAAPIGRSGRSRIAAGRTPRPTWTPIPLRTRPRRL